MCVRVVWCVCVCVCGVCLDIQMLCICVSFCHLWPVHLCIIFSVLPLINDAVFENNGFITDFELLCIFCMKHFSF